MNLDYKNVIFREGTSSANLSSLIPHGLGPILTWRILGNVLKNSFSTPYSLYYIF